MSDSASIDSTYMAHNAMDYGLQAVLESPVQARVGDTIPLVVHVTWTHAPHAWLLLPQNSPENNQLTQLEQSTEQSRTIVNGKQTPELIVKYKMLAKDTGESAIPALHFQLPTPEGSPFEIQTKATTLYVKGPVHWGVGAGIGLLIVLLATVAFFWIKRRKLGVAVKVRESAQRRQVRERLELLAGRVMSADPRAWMRDLEVCVQEARNWPEAKSPLQVEAWRKLEDSFAQARYGGGPRDAWENKEWLRLARTALDIHKDQDHNDQEDENHG